MQRAVVELDLAGYSDIARELEENLGAEIVLQLNDQTQLFVDEGLRAIGLARADVVLATTGDGGILLFDTAEQVHRFARAVHEAAERHNREKTKASAQRWFRIGAATGDIAITEESGNRKMGGVTIANAVRLESAARPGQLLIDKVTFENLTAELQTQYQPEEEVAGKRQSLCENPVFRRSAG